MLFPHFLMVAHRSKQKVAQDEIQLANLAIWLSQPSPLGFDMYIHAQETKDGWIWREILTVPELVPHPAYETEKLSSEDLVKAVSYHGPLLNLNRNGTMWIATRLLWRAMVETTLAVKYLLLWTGLEALFGPDSPEKNYPSSLPTDCPFY